MTRTKEQVKAEIESVVSMYYNMLIPKDVFKRRERKLLVELAQLERNDNDRAG